MSDNVFNTFSFKKWSERLREQKLDEESQRQRIEQVARLKEKLKRERELRDASETLSDDDIEKLIAYLNAGNSLNGSQTTIIPGPTPAPASVPVSNNPPISPTSKNDNNFNNVKLKSDDEILSEILGYYQKNKTLDDITEEIPMEFKYNHKFGDYIHTNSQAQLFNPKQFEYNRKFGQAV